MILESEGCSRFLVLGGKGVDSHGDSRTPAGRTAVRRIVRELGRRLGTRRLEVKNREKRKVT